MTVQSETALELMNERMKLPSAFNQLMLTSRLVWRNVWLNYLEKEKNSSFKSLKGKI